MGGGNAPSSADEQTNEMMLVPAKDRKVGALRICLLFGCQYTRAGILVRLWRYSETDGLYSVEKQGDGSLLMRCREQGADMRCRLRRVKVW